MTNPIGIPNWLTHDMNNGIKQGIKYGLKYGLKQAVKQGIISGEDFGESGKQRHKLSAALPIIWRLTETQNNEKLALAKDNAGVWVAAVGGCRQLT